MMNHDHRQRTRARRVFVQRTGLLLVAALTSAACIFDQGNKDYKGGGRIDRGAKVNPSSSTTGTPTSPPPSSSGTGSSSASSSASTDTPPDDNGTPPDEGGDEG